MEHHEMMHRLMSLALSMNDIEGEAGFLAREGVYMAVGILVVPMGDLPGKSGDQLSMIGYDALETYRMEVMNP